MKKRAVLKDMVIDEISLVGRGANQGALQAIYKADTDEDLAKRMFNDVMSEMGVSEQVEEFMEMLLKTNGALGRSLVEIVRNPEYTNKKESMRESISQFVDTVNGMINQTEIIKQAPMKMEDGKQFPASDYAYVHDPEKSSTWKLRLTATPWGDPDPRIVGAAVAALGPGFRGQKVQIPSSDLGVVKAKVRTAWKKANPDKEELPAILKKEVEQMDKQLEFYKALSELDEKGKTFFKGIPEKERDELLEKGLEEVVTYVKQKTAPKNDETIELEGATIKKSEVGEGAFAVMKAQQERIDRAEKVAKEEREIRLQKELEDRAKVMFPNLKGSTEDKAQLLKSIEELPEGIKEQQLSMLKAADAAMSKAFKEIGQGGTIQGDANQQLDALAKKYSKEHDVSFAKAYTAVLETEEGRGLYAKTLQ
jgi:hypothetical protein